MDIYMFLSSIVKKAVITTWLYILWKKLKIKFNLDWFLCFEFQRKIRMCYFTIESNGGYLEYGIRHMVYGKNPVPKPPR